MANELKYAVKALLKFAQENNELKAKCEKYEAEKRALSVALKMAEKGLIEYSQLMEKAAALVKEDLNVIEKALEFNMNNLFSIGSAAMAKVAGVDTKDMNHSDIRKQFEDFLLTNYS